MEANQPSFLHQHRSDDLLFVPREIEPRRKGERAPLERGIFANLEGLPLLGLSPSPISFCLPSPFHASPCNVWPNVFTPQPQPKNLLAPNRLRLRPGSGLAACRCG